MPKMLFLLHGMGVAPQGWSKPVQKALSDAAQNYAWFKDKPLSERLDFIEIRYDDVFGGYLETWDRQATALQAFASAQNVALPFDLSGYLQGCSATEKKFFWSHIVDVLLYRFFPVVRDEVRARVVRQISGPLAEQIRDFGHADASVLCHSLGTSVGHDALAWLGSQPLDGSNVFHPQNFQFRNIFMLANVSRILQTQFDPESLLCPLHPDSAGAGAYCNYFYNFRHSLDPIPMAKAFSPQDWGEDFSSVTDLEHLHEIEGLEAVQNVHGYEHTLKHPRVHIPVLNALFGGKITKAESGAAVAAFPRLSLSGALKAKADAFFAAIKALKDEVAAGPGDPGALVTAGMRFFSEVEKFRA